MPRNYDGIATDAPTVRFLAELCRYLNPQFIVEAGTWLGDFARAAAKACPNAKVMTADPLKVAYLPEGNIIYVQEDYEKMLERHVLQKGIIDFAFIDSGPPMATGKHEDGIRIRHYRATLPYMRNGGIIACHDLNSADWEGRDEIAADAGLLLYRAQGISLAQVRHA